jgi:hypothetical protein
MSSLRKDLIRLAYVQPHIRDYVLPLIKGASVDTRDPIDIEIDEWELKWQPDDARIIIIDHPDWSDAAELDLSGRIKYDDPYRIPPKIQQAVMKMFKQVWGRKVKA